MIEIIIIGIHLLSAFMGVGAIELINKVEEEGDDDGNFRKIMFIPVLGNIASIICIVGVILHFFNGDFKNISYEIKYKNLLRKKNKVKEAKKELEKKDEWQNKYNELKKEIYNKKEDNNDN